MKILVINCGSSSIKYEVFEGQDLRLLAGGLLEKIGTAEARLRQKRGLADGTFDFSETAGTGGRSRRRIRSDWTGSIVETESLPGMTTCSGSGTGWCTAVNGFRSRP